MQIRSAQPRDVGDIAALWLALVQEHQQQDSDLPTSVDDADEQYALMIHRAIRAVHQHDFYFNDYVQQALLKRVRKQSRPSFQQNIVNLLTAREKEVIGLICQELSSKEIADQLFISNKTVETHRKNIREKIGVKNTAGIVIFAMQNGLVPGLNGNG